MSYAGDWFQPDEYDTYGTRVAWADGSTATGASAAFQDDPNNPLYPLSGDDAADLSLRLNLAESATLSGSGVPPVEIVGWLPNLFNPENGYRVSNGAQRVGPKDGALDPPTWMLPNLSPPADAIGYEWETQTGQVTSTTLTLANVVPHGSVNDFTDTDNDGHLAALGQWALDLKVGGDRDTIPRDYSGTTIASWEYTGIDVAPITADIDLVGVVSETGHFVMLGQASASVTDFDRDVYNGWTCSLQMTARDYALSGEQTPSPGYGDFSVRYRIRPPRLRWLFAEPPTTPTLAPLRQFPRDDTRATSSATRVWSSSRQGSLRRHGYH